MKLFSHVQCHLCALKSLCDYARPDDSFGWQKYVLHDGDKQYRYDMAELDKATLNCPLKKKVLEQ